MLLAFPGGVNALMEKDTAVAYATLQGKVVNVGSSEELPRWGGRTQMAVCEGRRQSRAKREGAEGPHTWWVVVSDSTIIAEWTRATKLRPVTETRRSSRDGLAVGVSRRDVKTVFARSSRRRPTSLGPPH